MPDVFDPENNEYGRSGEVIRALAQACPRFVPWTDARELLRGAGPNSDAGLFGQYLAECVLANDAHEVETAFLIIEDLLRQDDAQLDDVIYSGLMESLTTYLQDARLEPESVRPLMGPKTASAWDVVHPTRGSEG